MPNIVTYDSLLAMMPAESHVAARHRCGDMHDFCLAGAQGGEAFVNHIETSYGPAANAADWVPLAQFENYDGYRAMFESQSKNRMGAAALDEPSRVAVHGVADIRLLPRTHRRLLRL